MINIFKNIVDFFRKTALELRRVSWISRRQTITLSLIVIFFLVFGTIYVLSADQLFLLLRKELILQSL